MAKEANKTRRRAGRRTVEEITPAQERTLKAIQDFILEHGYSPTLRELGEILNIGLTPVNDSLKHLIRKGYLTKEPNKRRSIAVVDSPQTEQVLGKRIPNLRSLPLYGGVAAGEPALVEDNLIGEAMVPEDLLGSGEYFALRVQGESMRDAGIQDGDTVIVKKQQLAQHGAIVVALIEDEATIKRLYWRDGVLELRPENSKFQPIPVRPDANFRILGVVLAPSRR